MHQGTTSEPRSFSTQALTWQPGDTGAVRIFHAAQAALPVLDGPRLCR